MQICFLVSQPSGSSTHPCFVELSGPSFLRLLKISSWSVVSGGSGFVYHVIDNSTSWSSDTCRCYAAFSGLSFNLLFSCRKLNAYCNPVQVLSAWKWKFMRSTQCVPHWTLQSSQAAASSMHWIYSATARLLAINTSTKSENCIGTVLPLQLFVAAWRTKTGLIKARGKPSKMKVAVPTVLWKAICQSAG